MQRIYSGNNPEMFAIFKGLLEEAGIPVVEQNETFARTLLVRESFLAP